MDGYVRMTERVPEKAGYYTVWRRTGPRGGLAAEHLYFWDGRIWKTRGGAVSKAVVAWQDRELLAKERAEQAR